MDTDRANTIRVKPNPSIPSFCFLGFFLMVSFSTSLSLSNYSIDDSLVAQSQLPFGPLTKMILFAAAALLSTKLTPLHKKHRLLVAAAVVLSLGAIFTIASRSSVGATALWMNACGSIVISVGTVPLYLAWMELYANMDMRHVLAYYTATHALSSFLSFALTLVSSPAFVSGAIVAFPLVSTALLIVSSHRIEHVSFAQGEAVSSGWSFPLKPVVLFAGFTFCNNFLRGFLSGAGRGYALFGVLIVSATVLVVILLLFKRFSIRSLYLISLPMAVAGALCSLIDLPNAALIGSLLTNGAYTLFSIFITAVLCNISFRYGVNPLWTFGFTQSALALAQIISQSVHASFDVHLQNAAFYTLCVCLIATVIVILFVVFMSDKDFTSTWGMTLSSKKTPLQDQEALPDAIEQAAYIARIKGLTRREEEILAMLLDDRTVAGIENALYISNSTAKTHIQHIYKKLGVHSKQECIETCRTL
ncbi:response regulator transcription factor [Raoultibacter massiliensis]|uniref:response regulator transcription factor n=1 Tax=Raoultibacter massiliensis TaxID=1852371 RepID=UPI003A8C8DE4